MVDLFRHAKRACSWKVTTLARRVSSYRFLVANGIGKNGGLLGTPYALGNDLSYTLQLGIEPVDGLRLSISGVANRLPQGSATQFDNVVVPEDMTSTLITGSVSHMSLDKKFEFIAEYYYNNHNYETLADKSLTGGILYAGYRVTPRLIPYFFAEYFDFPANDPYYPAVNEYTGQRYVGAAEYNLGVRYKVSANLMLKMEGALLDQDEFGNSIGLKTQVAFGF